jgi:TetR/AcrR family transcriptional regulator, mexCD-oprJ operon repressor
VPRGSALRDRIALQILDSACTVLAERGASATMDEIADAAGIGRATLYRYYPNRGTLLRALAEAAFREIKEAVRLADLEGVAFPEALARLTRTLLSLATKYVTLAHEEKLGMEADVAREVGTPIRMLFDRGAAEGSLRPDVPAGAMADLYVWLLRWGMETTMRHELSVERASGVILSLTVSSQGS